MRKRSGVVFLIVTGGVCAGLLWASQGLTDYAHRPSGTSAISSAGVFLDAHTNDQESAAIRSTPSRQPSGAWAGLPAGVLSSAQADGWKDVAIQSILSRRPFGSRTSVPDDAFSGARASSQKGITFRSVVAQRPYGSTAEVPAGAVSNAPMSMLPVSLALQAYSMSAPEFLSDPAAAQARSIAVGDVSGDGRDDLVFLSLRTAAIPWDSRMEIYVAYQRVDGRLDHAVKIAESGNNLAYQLLIADLDNDGIGEIITATVDGVMVLRSGEDGTFTSSTTVVGDPFDIVVTDVDRDGYLDVLVDSSDTSATVIHGDGHGLFDRTSTLPLPSSEVRTTGDVTGDGLDDLILATIFNTALEEFRIYPALASGGYAAPVVLSLPIGSNHTSSLAVGDFNADGRGDLVLDEARDGANLRLFFQDPQGNLTSSRDIVRLRGSGLLLATDLDRDGRTDFAVAHTGWGYIGYYLQTETGFTLENVIEAYQHGGRRNYFAAGDLNHDGCGDLIVARGSQSPAIMYGRGCAHHRYAHCRLPPRRIDGSGFGSVGLASPPAHQYDSDIGAHFREIPDARP